MFTRSCAQARSAGPCRSPARTWPPVPCPPPTLHTSLPMWGPRRFGGFWKTCFSFLEQRSYLLASCFVSLATCQNCPCFTAGQTKAWEVKAQQGDRWRHRTRLCSGDYAGAFTSPRVRAGAGERAPELTSCSAIRGWICPVQRGDPSLAGARARAQLHRGWAVTDRVSGRELVTATRTLHSGRAFHARRSQGHGCASRGHVCIPEVCVWRPGRKEGPGAPSASPAGPASVGAGEQPLCAPSLGIQGHP